MIPIVDTTTPKQAPSDKSAIVEMLVRQFPKIVESLDPQQPNSTWFELAKLLGYARTIKEKRKK